MYGRVSRLLTNDEIAKWYDVGKKVNENSGQASQSEAVPEDETQNRAFLSVLLGCGARHDDALRVDHLAHHAARGVGGAHQDRTEAELLGCYFLQIAE